MKTCIVICSSVLFLFSTFQFVNAQGLLNKIKKQTEDKLLKKTDETIDDSLFGKDENNSDKNGNPNSDGNNSKGEGLIINPPDVLKNIADAEQAFNVKNFGTAKYAVRQAMLGIEMEIGHNILESLPSTVDGLKIVDEKDRVTSMSYGFVGLTMERVYEGEDKELKVSIGNNSAWLSAANMMLTSGTYSSNGDDQNYKQTTFKGYRSILQFDNSSGYTLSVPFGQSSIFVLNGINYESETEIMSVAENFDIESIKTELGEK